jgi:hypothetical protein
MGYREKDLLEVHTPRLLAYKHWPWLQVPCEELWGDLDVFSQISCRHFYGESRESLAAWIASIEPQDTEPTTKDVAHELAGLPA